MFRNVDDTASLTLRRVRRQTLDTLYEAKTLTGLPICRLVDEIVWLGVEEHLSALQPRQDHVHEATASLTLRRVRRQTIDTLYEAKALTGLPICRLVDEIVWRWAEEHPSMLQMRQAQVRRLVDEFGQGGIPL